MNRVSKFGFSVLCLALSNISFASDTRGYNMLPVGTNVIESQYSSIVSTQKAASGLQGKQIQDMLYVRDTYFFNLGGDLAAAYVMLPYTKQKLDITKPITLSKTSEGFSDIKLLFALGVYNMPALSREQFQSFDKNGLHAACSLQVTLSTGSYSNTSLVNSGSNRDSYKPECAAYWVNNQFQADLFVGDTFYSRNDSYSGHKTLSQNHVYNVETRLSYNFTPTFWASTDFIYTQGGESSVNEIKQRDEQNNLNAGVTLAYKFAPTQVIKVLYQKTVSGADHAPQMQRGLGVTYTVAF